MQTPQGGNPSVTFCVSTAQSAVKSALEENVTESGDKPQQTTSNNPAGSSCRLNSGAHELETKKLVDVQYGRMGGEEWQNTYRNGRNWEFGVKGYMKSYTI